MSPSEEWRTFALKLQQLTYDAVDMAPAVTEALLQAAEAAYAVAEEVDKR